MTTITVPVEVASCRECPKADNNGRGGDGFSSSPATLIWECTAPGGPDYISNEQASVVHAKCPYKEDMTEGMPTAVYKALMHVRKFYPDVTQVIYGADLRWHFCDEDFDGPSLPSTFDIAPLEDAADSLTSYPAVFALPDEE